MNRIKKIYLVVNRFSSYYGLFKQHNDGCIMIGDHELTIKNIKVSSKRIILRVDKVRRSKIYVDLQSGFDVKVQIKDRITEYNVTTTKSEKYINNFSKPDTIPEDKYPFIISGCPSHYRPLCLFYYKQAETACSLKDSSLDEKSQDEESQDEESQDEESSNEESLDGKSLNEGSLDGKSVDGGSLDEGSLDGDSSNEESLDDESLNQESLNQESLNKEPKKKSKKKSLVRRIFEEFLE